MVNVRFLGVLLVQLCVILYFQGLYPDSLEDTLPPSLRQQLLATARGLQTSVEDARSVLSFSFAMDEAERLEENPLCSEDYNSQEDAGFNRRPEGRVDPPPETEVCSRWARDTFLLYRIIGNDLPPRHHANQTINNLRFVLEHEPDLQDCEKWWVINRVVDQNKVAAVVALLDEYQQNYIVIPFEEESFRKVDFVFNRGVVPQYYALYKKSMMQKYVIQDIYHTKNLYVMNNNGARNACVHHGRTRAKWILPLDGNIFINEKAWTVLLDSVHNIHGCQIRYVMMPMARILNNDVVLKEGFDPTEAIEEPQVMFRCDAREEFDPGMRYGRRPKVDLFFRLNYPGVWDAYKYDSYSMLSHEANKTLSIDTGEYLTAGYVLRLAAGTSKKLETTGEGGKKSARHIARLDGITNFIDAIDEKILSRVVSEDTMFVYSDTLLSAMEPHSLDEMPDTAEQWAAQKLVRRAEQAMEQLQNADRFGLSVVEKTTKPPSGNKHDYYSLSPNHFPNPTKENGVPYEPLVDGQAPPEWVLRDLESEKYDATRFQQMMDNVTLLTLSWRFTANESFSDTAAELVRHWFLNNETRMNPHLEYAHMIYTGDLLPKFQGLTGGNVVKRFVRGAHTGVLEGLSLYYFLDAIRLLKRSGSLDPLEFVKFKSWIREYYFWLQNGLRHGPFPGFDHPAWIYPGYGSQGAAGQEAQRSNDFHGILYDVQLAAIATFLNEFSTNSGVNQGSWDAFLHTVHLSRLRLMQYDRYKYDPADPKYCLHLHGWEVLSRMARMVHINIWRGESALGDGLQKEFGALLKQAKSAITHLRHDAQGRWLGPLNPAHEEDLLRAGAALLGCEPAPHWRLITGPPSKKVTKEIATTTETVDRSNLCTELGPWDVSALAERKERLLKCLEQKPTNGFIAFSQHSGFNNQVKALYNAIRFAALLNRTLIVPPVQPQSLMAYGSCQTEVLSPTYMIHQSNMLIKSELMDKPGKYIPLGKVVDFSTVSPRFVLMIDHRDFYELLAPNIIASKSVRDVDSDCMDNQWVYDRPDLEGEVKEVKNAKYLHTNVTWESTVVYRDVVKHLGTAPEQLVRFGSMFGNDYLMPSANAMRMIDVMRKTQVLFMTEPINTAAMSIRDQLGGQYASWHLRLGDTFVRDAQRRAAERNETVTMEDITREVSQKVESELPEGTTLYIATDLGQAQRPKLLGHIFPKYRVFFLDDFKDELELLATQIPSPAGYLDTMVAVCAPLEFFGTTGSSFSANIRNLRRNNACDVKS